MEYAYVERDLGSDEAEAASAVTESKAPLLRRISERHRRLARLIAEGLPPGDAAVACGYTVARVSVLQTDPAFSELVHFYRGQIDEQFSTIAEKLSTMTGIAADEIIERLEDRPEEFEKDDLLKIITAGADRLGFSPKAAPQSGDITVNLAVRLAEARQRLAPTIEGSAKRIQDDE